jgi:HAD superfamily hydrolase (TIGR01457 family)
MHLIPFVKRYKAFLIDLDGVIYLRRTLIPGADSFVDALRKEGKGFLFLTNNSSRTREDYVETLAGLGIDAETGQVVTSAYATSQYLAEEDPGSRVFPVGGSGLLEELRSHGLAVVMEGPVDYVVVGMDIQFNYETLAKAASLVRSGARFISTNRDATYPTEDGLLPGAGSVVAAIQTASGKRPLDIGKPSPRIFRICLEILGTGAGDTAVVGDRYETDILGGLRVGMGTVLVLSGVTRASEVGRFDPEPHLVVPSVAELVET